MFTAVTGVSGSGKSSLVSQALVELVRRHLGHEPEEVEATGRSWSRRRRGPGGRIVDGAGVIRRLVVVDQKPIGRTPRSNLATYTGLFDHVRKLFAATKQAKARKYDAGRFSFNVAKGRCETCEGEGFVMVELLFLPSVYAPCPTCHGSRYNAKTLEMHYHGKNIADVLGMTVDEAWEFFSDPAQEPHARRSLDMLRSVGVGYLRLGQPATELSGGEAQRIKLATELQRTARGDHSLRPRRADDGTASGGRGAAPRPAQRVGGRGEYRGRGRARRAGGGETDWVIDVGPGAGDEGGGWFAKQFQAARKLVARKDRGDGH